MEAVSALLALCVCGGGGGGDSPITGEFPFTRASDGEIDVLFYLRLKKTFE